MSSGLPSMIPSSDVKVLYAKHGFSQAQKGSHAMLNDYLETKLESVVKQSHLQASFQGRSGLTKEDAQKALNNTRGIPKGTY